MASSSSTLLSLSLSLVPPASRNPIIPEERASRSEPLSLAVPKVADGEVAPRHLLAVSRHLLLVRAPLLVGDLALGAALLALGDADEGVDDTDEEDGTTDAGADSYLGCVGEAGPLLLGFLGGGELVEGFVEFGFASGGGPLVVAVNFEVRWTYSSTLMLAWLPVSSL